MDGRNKWLLNVSNTFQIFAVNDAPTYTAPSQMQVRRLITTLLPQSHSDLPSSETYSRQRSRKAGKRNKRDWSGDVYVTDIGYRRCNSDDY